MNRHQLHQFFLNRLDFIPADLSLTLLPLQKLDEKGELLPGMNVQAYILLGTSKNTLCIPSGALMRGNQVYVQDESVTTTDGIVPVGFRAVDVTTGLANANYVEILSGLSEGDKVYVESASSDMNEGETEYYEGEGGY